jgi:hypothetical protein
VIETDSYDVNECLPKTRCESAARTGLLGHRCASFPHRRFPPAEVFHQVLKGKMVDMPFILFRMFNNDVVMRVMMAMIVLMVTLVDNDGWFVPDDDFVSPNHGHEC